MQCLVLTWASNRILQNRPILRFFPLLQPRKSVGAFWMVITGSWLDVLTLFENNPKRLPFCCSAKHQQKLLTSHLQTVNQSCFQFGFQGHRKSVLTNDSLANWQLRSIEASSPRTQMIAIAFGRCVGVPSFASSCFCVYFSKSPKPDLAGTERCLPHCRYKFLIHSIRKKQMLPSASLQSY